MPVFPNELFMFSQVFGMFPLTYTEQPDQKLRMEFSSRLFLKCLVIITFLTVSSYFALYEDFVGYLTGRPIRITSSTAVLPIVVEVVLLNLMAIVIFYGVTCNYPAFIQMCNILEKVDQTLRLKIHSPWLRFKMLVVLGQVTGLVTLTSVLRSRETPGVVLYIPFWMTYYIVGTLLLQFHCVIEDLTTRFKKINKRVEEEVMKQTFQRLLVVDLGLEKSTGSFEGASTVYQLKVLIDSYSELYKAVQQAKSFYRSQVLVAVSTTLIHNITTLYFLILDLQQPDISLLVLVQFAWALSRMLYMILLLWPCASLSQVTSETGPVVCSLITRDLLNPDTEEELESFLLKLRHFRVEFSALGFFPIHRNILTSIASSIATYLVVMLQLDDSSDLTVNSNVSVSTYNASYTN